MPWVNKMASCFICEKHLGENEGFCAGVDKNCKATDDPKEMIVVCGDKCKGAFEKKFDHGGKALSHYSRITGYVQSIDNWNKGKRQEFLDRKRYTI